MPAEEQTIVELAYPGEYLSRLGQAETKTCKIRLSRKGQGLLARMYASRGYNMQATLSHDCDLSSLPRTMAAFEACMGLEAFQKAQPSACPDFEA